MSPFLVDWSSKSIMPQQPVIVSDPAILGGTPCFRGTRVPVDSLIDYLEAGDSLNEFLDNFPSVRREPASKTFGAPCWTRMIYRRRLRVVRKEER